MNLVLRIAPIRCGAPGRAYNTPMLRFPSMGQAPRFFTVDEANELVAALQLEFGRIAQLRVEIGAAIEALGGAEIAVGVLQEGLDPPPGKRAEGELLRRLAAEISAVVERVNGLGCLVKDLENGLVDFYAMREGEPVFLCWQFGEPAVTHWHGVEEGFNGRRPIEGVSVTPPEFMN